VRVLKSMWSAPREVSQRVPSTMSYSPKGRMKMSSMKCSSSMEKGVRRSTPGQGTLSPWDTVRIAVHGTTSSVVEAARSAVTKSWDEPESTRARRRTGPTRTMNCSASPCSGAVSAVWMPVRASSNTQIIRFLCAGVLIVLYCIQKKQFLARMVVAANIPFIAVETKVEATTLLDLRRRQAADGATGYHGGRRGGRAEILLGRQGPTGFVCAGRDDSDGLVARERSGGGEAGADRRAAVALLRRSKELARLIAMSNVWGP